MRCSLSFVVWSCFLFGVVCGLLSLGVCISLLLFARSVLLVVVCCLLIGVVCCVLRARCFRFFVV